MWAAPAFLFGLMTLALPLWLHRFARRTDQEQPFSSLMLMAPGTVQRSRRRQWRHLLLLAARLLLLALLVLAFAGPSLPRPPLLPAAQPARLHVLVLDASLSMQASGRWAGAQQAALQTIDDLPGADRALLARADHAVQVLQPAVSVTDRGLLRAAVASARAGQSRLDYGALTRAVASLASGAGQPVVWHLFTDVQASAFPARFADLQPPPGVRLELVDVSRGGEPPGNQWALGPVPLPDEAGQVQLSAQGSEPGAASRQLLLLAEGQERGRRTLPPAGGVVRLPLDLPATGEHRLAARLQPADALPGDDTHHVVWRRLEPRVLLVTADPAAEGAAYLRAALAARDAPPLRVTEVRPGRWPSLSLPDHAAVLLADAALLSQADVRQLRAYLAQGGVVLQMAGARAAALRRLPLGGLVLASGAARAGGATETRVAEVAGDHPVLRDAAQWRALRVLRHVPLQPGAEGAGAPPPRVLLGLESGAPLLLEQRIGAGRLLTLATPLDREWNDLALQPGFVRFIGDVVVRLSGSEASVPALQVGEVAQVSLDGLPGAQVFGPRGQRLRVLEARDGQLRFVPLEAGFHELRGGGRSRWLAVNTDPRESDLSVAGADLRRRWLALQPSSAATPAAAAAAAAGLRGWPVWQAVLLAALLLALLEALLANRHLHIEREARA